MSGYEVVQVSISLAAGESRTVSVPCSTGKRPIGAGYAQASGSVVVLEIVPLTSAWQVSLRNASQTSGASLTAHGICIIAG